MKLTKNIQKAIIKAAILHSGQVRKEGKFPFIIHPYSVAAILSNYPDNEDTIIAGLLHDVLEDVPGYSEIDMGEDFGEKITEIVKGVSEDKDLNNKSNEKESWDYRKNKYLEGLKNDSQESLMVCAADKIHNLASMAEAYKEKETMAFENFNASIEKRIKFHRDVLAILKKRLKNNIVAELENKQREFVEILRKKS